MGYDPGETFGKEVIVFTGKRSVSVQTTHMCSPWSKQTKIFMDRTKEELISTTNSEHSKKTKKINIQSSKITQAGHPTNIFSALPWSPQTAILPGASK